MVPDIVYHYCSTDVFTKIIQNKAMRLSDITKSNDSMELKWAFNFVNDVFRDLCVEQSDFFTDVSSEIIIDQSIIKNRALACCFSEEGDLLSQWRGYADDAQGFSIGFDTEVLAEFGSVAQINWEDRGYRYYSGFQFGKIIYDDQEQMKEIKQIARHFLPPKSQYKKIAPYDFWVKVINSSPIISFIKNPFFKEEKEWRLCEWGIGGTRELFWADKEDEYPLSGIFYQNRKNDLVRYLNLSFAKHPEFIKRVIIGPKNKASVDDVKHFLESNHISCEVEKSAGSYQ